MGGAERAGTVVGSVELQRVIYLNTLAGASGGCHPPTVTLVTSEVIVPVQKPLKPDPLSKSPGPHSIETGDLATTVHTYLHPEPKDKFTTGRNR